MSIEHLTIKELREIAAMFPLVANAPEPNTKPHPFAGRFVILRCRDAGVHAGYLDSQTGDQAVLSSSRRLWSWTALGGVALSGLSMHGLKTGKVDTLVPQIALTGVIETIPCSLFAERSIYDAK
jgi:hypothetical protein